MRLTKTKKFIFFLGVEPNRYGLTKKREKKKRLKEYTLSKKIKNNEVILPGYNYVEKKIFRLNSLDLPYSNIQEYKRRHTVTGCKEYGHLLNDLPFSQIFDLRLKEYLSNR